MKPTRPRSRNRRALALPKKGDRGVLPSGRQVVLKADGKCEAIEVRSADGEMELSIALTRQGPVLRLRGVRLEIDSTETVTVNCRQFDLNTTRGVTLRAGGNVGIRTNAEIRMRSGAQTFIDGDYVNLNCLNRKGYHDHPAGKKRPRLPSAGSKDSARALPPTSGSGGSGKQDEET